MIQRNVNVVNVVRALATSAAARNKKMPKFYRQNRKRIDPRYFLNETIEREELEEGEGCQKCKKCGELHEGDCGTKEIVEQDDQENPGEHIYVVDTQDGDKVIKVGHHQTRGWSHQLKSSNTVYKVGDRCTDCNKYIQPKNAEDR